MNRIPTHHLSITQISDHRFLLAIIICWLAGLLIVSQPTSVLADDILADGDLSQLSADAERAALLINQLRADAGLAPLRVHPLLTLAANQHILDMKGSGVYGHYGSDGSSVHQRIARTGYATDGWNGENWAVSSTVEKSIGWWMDDAPHRDNLLNRSYTEMGIGVAPHPGGWGLILVVDFSTGNVNGTEGFVPKGDQVAAGSDTDRYQPVADSGLRYQVVPGDTLFSIGQRYAVDWQSIAQLNGLANGSFLQVGAELRIPSTGANSAGNSLAESHYTVAAGDTLLGITLQFGVEWSELAAINGLSDQSVLQIGDVLIIPGQHSTATEELAQVSYTHSVSTGETIWSIAARYNIDWQALLQKNSLTEQTLLQIGQVLTLP